LRRNNGNQLLHRAAPKYRDAGRRQIPAPNHIRSSVR
jgi:hypothetical protein